ncbi:MAG: HAMP domain-containing protein, partial [Eubacteriales bacterium]|nr:HAMP domain-containing protein [Eubacteriales bacterium]
MQKSLFFRRVLLLLLMALLLWTVLTAVIYGLISRPVFTRIKVDELRPKAESVASIAAAGFIQQDPYLDSLLSSAFEFFDAWVFVIDGLSGEIRSSSLPQSTASEQEIHQLLEQNSPQILSGDYTSIWFTRKIQSGEMLFIGVPVSVSFGRQNSVVGAVYFVRPLEELNAGLRSLNIALLGASLLVLLIMILPTYLATVHLIRPLRQTRDVALAMAKGNFTVRADTRMHGEIGELATTMNQLAAQLDQSISALTLERNRLRQIIEGMGEGLIAVDPDRSITRMNRAAARLLMIPDSDPAQSDGLTATVFSSYPELEQAISRVLSDGDPL